MIKDIYPVKAQFLSGQPIGITVELQNDGTVEKRFSLRTVVSWLNQEVQELSTETVLEPESQKTVILSLDPQTTDMKGYGVDVYLLADGLEAESASTSFDVVSNWRKAPRYGFLSDFYTGEKGDAEDVKWLNKLHLNLVQFYDWMYKHDDLVAEKNEYTDLMGRELSLDVVKEKVDLCHDYGMKAIAYGAVYAASKGFYEKHKDWALYQSDGKEYDFINLFTIMNIAEKSPWHQHIIGEYKRSVELVDFDGIHMDTYGFPKTGVSKLNGIEEMIRLEEHFPALINNTRKALEEIKKDIGLIFNNVGNWPVDTVAAAEQDAIYVEVWKPYTRYHHIQQIISWSKHLSGNKPVILAAYLEPFRLDRPERAEAGALLMTAVTAALGANHLLLGENRGILTQAYYVDYSQLRESFIRKIRGYYDFNIRYANLLNRDSLRNVSMTHVDGDNLEYVFEQVDYSTCGEAGKVWTVVREDDQLKTISFINLTGNDDIWNTGKEEPVPAQGIKVKVLLEKGVKSVFAASPDRNFGRPQPIQYMITQELRGNTLELTLPELHVWSVLAIELA